MGPTRARDLLVAAVAVAVIGYLFIGQLDRNCPPVTLWTGLSLLAVALAEAVWGASVRRRIGEGRIGAGAGRLHPLAVARTVAVAKASAWAGAVALGWWVAVLVYLVPRRGDLRVAAADTPGAAVAALSALLLIVGSLWLQHCCKSPAEPPTEPDR